MLLKPRFIESLRNLAALPGGDVVNGLADALAGSQPVVGVRINRRKFADSGLSLRDGLRPVAWCSDGYIIDGERPRFTIDPALHQGLYYVQDPSSMVISHVVKQLAHDITSPIVYVDACAAPGGKTTAAIDALPEGSLVVANEFDRRRAEILRENIERWGYDATVITRGDTAAYRSLRNFADIVAIDAPCSGEGMMRKDETAVEQWSPSLVDQCAALQREIIENLSDTLRPGGYLIYSTCTFNRQENEENVAWIVDSLGFEPVSIDLPDSCGIASGIETPYPVMRFIPGRVEGEGLFMAVFRKPCHEPRSVKPVKVKEKSLQVKFPARLKSPDNYIYEETADRVNAIPRMWAAEIATLSRVADVIHAGVPMGTIKGRDLIPSVALAASRALDTSSCPTCEVDYSTAIAYLRGEALRLDGIDPAPPRGILLLTYRGIPLGFVKNLGNRANNLYPDSRAIKTTHIDPSDASPVFGNR